MQEGAESRPRDVFEKDPLNGDLHKKACVC